MTDNRTTELRVKLDSLGVEHHDTEHMTEWHDANGLKWNYFSNGENTDLTLETPWEGCTPEQAIAATLGNTTCEYVIEDNMNESEGMGDVWFRCTNCDMCFDYADDWLFKMPHCPKCGATVKGVR